MIVQQGSINTTALTVPDLYVQIVPPAVQNINGVPTNILGVVGTATFGPVNSPTTVGNPQQAQAIFGPQQNRVNDLVTAVSVATQQGANNFRLVRVTDGTDVAASVLVQSTCITFTGKYTGSFGNSISVQLAVGTAANTQKAIVTAPGIVSEVFDNLGSGLSGNALWLAIAAGINNGSSIIRGPSLLIIATAGVGTAAPIPATVNLTGGTDGVTSITQSVMLGSDAATPRTGMYALRGTGASVAMLADLTATASFATQVSYGLSEGTYMIGATVSGDTISNAVSVKSSAGIDSYIFKYMFGDWVYWLDTVNNTQRLLSPQAFVAGLLANLSPQNSSLNKPIQAVVGTQKTFANQLYAEADIQQLVAAGIDVITNPSVGGPYFSCRVGHNSSSNAMINGDNYTRMTNYLAATLDAGMGQFVGNTESPSLLTNVADTLGNFFQTLWDQGLIGNAAGTIPYSVECDVNDNPAARVALGYLQADVNVQYLAIAEKFLINLQGGQSVQITRVQTNLA